MDHLCRKYVQFEPAAGTEAQAMADVCVDLAELCGDRLGGGLVRQEAELTSDERQYLMSVERGDTPSVLHLLQEAKIGGRVRLNRNCIDPFGRTALMIAIENDNIEMMGMLLRFGVALGDALLHAISEDNVEATQLLLAHDKVIPVSDFESTYDSSANKDKVAKITAKWKKLTTKRELGSDSNDFKNTSMPQVDSSMPHSPISAPSPRFEPISSSFSPDITPVIMAAHRDNYEILKILLDRGDKILKPHDVRCSCTDCVSKSSDDSLNHSRSRINAYRALASPSLIALSSKDPVLTAFELSWELRLLSKLENELKSDYEKLAKQCEDFAVDLLDQVRGSKELEILLNYNATPANYLGDGEEFKMNLDRLKLAIKYKQKRFVANSSCQQLLASLWYEGLLGFRRRHVVFKILLTVSVSVLFPVLSIVYMIAPKTSVGQFMRRPFIKFICHSASYMMFLFLLILASQRIESIINLGSSESDEDSTAKKMTREVRGAPPTSIEWMILAYVAGLIWAEIKQLWDQGLKSYVQDMWNILDFITNALYIATYTLKLVAYLKVQEERRVHNPSAGIGREHWDAFDPTLISEGLFAAANIFSSLKLIYIFTVNPHLGPLQISLGRMVIDIMKFLFIALLVCFSYSCGVNQLYWYYAEARNRDCAECQERRKIEAGGDCNCDTTLSNLFEIIQTLYFAVYGLVDINHFELREKHEFTQFVGKLMYGTYLGIMTIVLINMLIAMLSSSFQKISNDADTEWKFARSRLWMSYFDEGGTVPAPFNIIPTPKTAWSLVVWLWETLCRCSKTARTNKWQSIRKSLKQKKERDAMYQSVIRELIKRYIIKRQKNMNSEGVNEDDMNEIKQDISSFRFELLEILRSSGMKVTSTPTNPPQTSSGRMRRRNSRMSFNKLCQDTMNMTPTSALPHQNSLPSPSSVGSPWSPTPTSSPSPQFSFFTDPKVPAPAHSATSSQAKGGLHTLEEECAEDESTSAPTDSSSASKTATGDARQLYGAGVGNCKQKRPTHLFSAFTEEYDPTRSETIGTAKSEAETEYGNDVSEAGNQTSGASKPKVQGQKSWPPGKQVNFQVKVARSPEPATESLVVQSDDV